MAQLMQQTLQDTEGTAAAAAAASTASAAAARSVPPGAAADGGVIAAAAARGAVKPSVDRTERCREHDSNRGHMETLHNA
jgi:hypothetical protein